MLSHTQAGNPVCSFSLATTDHWTDENGQRQEKTEWHRIVAWKKQAEFASKYLKKGSQAFVQGKLRYKTWTDQSGVERTSAEIHADQVKLLGGSRRQEESPPVGERRRSKPPKIEGQFGGQDMGEAPF